MTTFHAPWSILTLRVQVGATTRTVEFDAITTGGSKFSTADKDLIAALRKHPRFGDDFNCVGGSSEEPVQSQAASSGLATGEQNPPSPEEGAGDLNPTTGEQHPENAEGGAENLNPSEGAQTPSDPEEVTGGLNPEAGELLPEKTEGKASNALVFASPTDAANFLSEKYGIAKTKLKTKKAILAEASLLHLSITLE